MGQTRYMSGDANDGRSSIHRMRVSLYLVTSFDSAWESVFLPWFAAIAPRAVEEAVPVAVVAPFRSHAHLLRNRLLAHDISLLGVRFLVPAQLREFLQTAEMPHVPLRENLRLLLSVAADRCASDSERDHKIDNALVARSVAREPDELLRAIDSVAAAGASFANLASPVLAEIARRFEQILKCCGCALVAEADRLLLQAARTGKPRFSSLLITGFDGAHWSLRPLLRAAARSAQDTTVILRGSRHEAGELDRTWISTWEENFGPAQIIAYPEAEPRFSTLLTLPETATEINERKRNPSTDVHFVLGHDSDEQARAIVALALGFLSDPSCRRLAILLPGPGALARLVSSWLEKLRIPHNDAIAHRMRGALDTEEWRAWLNLQDRPQLEPLLRFLEHSRAGTASFAPLQLYPIQDRLRHACGDILINSVHVLREYCRSKTDEPDYHELGAGLDAIRFLPEHATFETFVELADEIFRTFKWTEHAAELKRLARDWTGGLADDFPREYFLRWLSEVFAESSLVREECGDHPYARVQLLRHDEAENESWSHVILAGLNEGVWPPRDDESPFLPDDAIASLNSRNRQQSKRFGEGQQVAREGAALCLGARDRRALALRQLLNVIESTTGGTAVAAECYTHSPREQAINPGEFLARLYFNARGQPLSQNKMAQIYKRTREWLAQSDLFKSIWPDDVDVKQTATAYRARRRPGTEFGEYEFAFREGSPPEHQITLSATDIGNLLRRPALVWMKVFLRLEAEELNGGSWNLATGQWVHRWLAALGALPENRFLPRPSSGEIVRHTLAEADRFRQGVRSMLAACGRDREPDWWISGWRNARYLAEQFAEQLAANEDWPQLATEWRLDSPHVIPVGGEELRVRGRLDLVLARGKRAQEIWIVDYKTGEAEPLKSGPNLRKQLIAGEGVQICVYALALRRDFREIWASLLTRGANLEPQLGVAEIVAHDAIWKEIARMQRTGIFGMLGEIRSDFKFTGTYPLATLAIDKDLLDVKWECTHPAFAKARTNENAP